MKTEKRVENLFYFILGIFLVFALNSLYVDFFAKHLQEYSVFFDLPGQYITVIVLLVFLFTITSISNYQKAIPDTKNTFFLFLIVVLYTYHRFFSNTFDFFPINFYIKFLDFIYIPLILDFSSYLKLIFPPEPFPEKKLYGDSPILELKKNELGYGVEKFAEKISNIINENCFDTAYSIGIASKWGDGKTSMIYCIKSKLENSDDYIIVDFNPWLGFDSKVLVSDFFQSVTEKMNNDSLSKQILNYSDKLINKEGNQFYTFFKNIVPFLNNDSDSLERLFKSINKKLEVLHKKLIIFIDDVDRLDNNEVFQLLKIIRNTANFKNTFFIVAYDREYVNNAIVNINSYPSNNYLNKIINVELTLPYYDKIILSKLFEKKIIKLIGGKYESKILNAMKSFESFDIFSDGIDSKSSFGFFIDNLRDVKKLVDLIYVNYNDLLDEIDFPDMLYLGILQVKYPNVYRLILDRKSDIFYEQDGKIYIKTEEPNSSDIRKSIFKKLLNVLIRKKFLLREEEDKVLGIFKKLFDFKVNKSGLDLNFNFDEEYINSEKLKINNSRKFERYFAQIISRENISETDWTNFLKNNVEEERLKTVEVWISEGKEEDLINKIEDKSNFSGIEELLIIIKTIFQIGDSTSKIFSGKINISPNLLLNLFRDKNKSSAKIIKDNYSRIKSLMFQLLKNKKEFNFEVLEKSYNENPNDAFNGSRIEILEKEKEHQLLKKYFLEYLETEEEINDDFWKYYHGAKTIDYKNLESGKPERKIYFDEDIKKALLEYINSSDKVSIFLTWFIQKWIGGSGLYLIKKHMIEDIFTNTEKFEIFLDKMKGLYGANKSLEEFITFYEECKANDFKQAVKFEFKYLFSENKVEEN